MIVDELYIFFKLITNILPVMSINVNFRQDISCLADNTIFVLNVQVEILSIAKNDM